MDNINLYQDLFGDDKAVKVDDITIKYNDNDELYVNEVPNNIIKFTNPYILLGSDISNNTIQTKLTNDYIIDSTINQSKILNLISDLLAINNKFNDYYLKNQTYSQTEINLLLNNYVTITTLITTLNNYYLKNETYSQTEINNLFYNKTYIDTLINLYYTKIQSDNLYYNKLYIDSFFYNKTYIDNLITSYYTKIESDNKYALITSLNNYVLTSFLTSNYFTQTQINNRFADYYSQTEINLLLNNYALVTSLNNYVLTSFLTSNYYDKTLLYTQTESNNRYALISSLNNYVLTSFLTSNYYDKTLLYTQTESNNRYALISSLNNYVLTSFLLSDYITANQIYTILSGYATNSNLSNYYTKIESDNLYYSKSYINSLLSNKLDTSTYNTDQTNLALKFFSPLSTGSLRKNYFEYADLTSTKYIFFSQNGTNQYQTINFIDDNTLQASKLVNNSIGQTQLDTTFYNKSIYCYENWRDIFTGNISLAALNSPASNGIYYLRASKSGPLLTQISWDLTSNLSSNITLPYSITTNNSGYGSALTANFQLIQNGNPTISTGIEFSCINNGDSSYYGSFGFNSSGRYPTTSPNYIQYPNPYTYIFSKRDFNLFCFNSITNGIDLRIQCLPAITKIYNETEILGNLNSSGIVKTDFIQGFSAANTIKFNNQLDMQTNNIINYNLGYTNMLKTTSGTINMKTVTNNTYVSWGCCADDDVGIGMGLFRNNSGVYSVYHSINKNYTFGTASIILYSINYIPGVARHTLLAENIDFNMGTNSTIYTNWLRPNSSVINCYNIRMQTNLDMNGYTLLNYSGGGGGINTSDSIPVNTGGYNYLTKSASTVNGITMYGLDSNSFIIQNNSGENCGVGFCGSQDNMSFWSATDGNNFMSFVDEDVGSSRFGGINGSAQIFTGSSRLRKHSIKDKNNNNVLDRFLKIKIKSYGYKFELNDDFDEKKKQRIINKSKKQQIGIILEELYNIFPNCCSFYNNALNDELIDNENVKNKEITFNNKPKLEDINLINEGIIYEKLLLYNIIAFQEYVNKTDLEIENFKLETKSLCKTINDLQNKNIELENKYNDLENKFNLLLNKLNLTI